MAALRFLLLAALAILWTGAARAADRVALVIGNSDYQAVTTLENPRNDALDLSVALEGLGFEVILGRDLTREGMQQSTRDFADAAKDAQVALFFYAGHGFQVGGQNYLVPTDARIARPEDATLQTFAMTEILAALKDSPALKLVFLDACRDNPFGATLQRDGEAGEGLARIGTEADFLFAYATQPGNVAFDGTGRNSFFSAALLHHLYTPGQPISDMMIAVRRDVMTATGGQQIPWENSSLTRQFAFDTGPPDMSQETLFYQVATGAQDDALMRLYVDLYPEGAHVGEAQSWLQTGTSTRSIERGDDAEQARRLWTLAQRSRVRPLLQFYLDRYPEGADAAQARQLLDLLPDLQDSTPAALCERLATHPRDAVAGTSGVPFERLQQNAVAAIQACSAAVTQSPNLPHYVALLARATAASGDLGRAVALYETAADRGDLRAMVSLAQLKESGNGMAVDIPGAMALYEKAAEAGSLDAMNNLAVTLFEGKDLPKDQPRALALLQRASDEGSAQATYNLGYMRLNEVIGTPPEALDFFLRAAKGGDTRGYRAAAIMLDKGGMIDRNPAEAANALLRATAEDDGTVLADLSANTGGWSSDTITQVQLKLAAAGLYTSDVDGRTGPGFTAALTGWRNGGFDAEVLGE
ncbi:caspase family protein [Paracoccus zhejiangensis]|uniref:Peptidase C14, caspase catalytic subunit p20 n=1 Tax=Paracoccus zhejiangensis TaxID=1077935 RepID=A0A2H5F4R9_9RHOB|nr:caspase family protein [Paracoccus zhejiangensis]AUH66541.1 peptidase C14, caspase catalytic subunit p20 [Paracoccus zhejiangensis]